jgi:UDP-N-acetyl-D-mannosaminuronic acid dehydrogenase
MKKICVVGLGYIGLPTACLFAKHGYDVLGVEINIRTIEKIKNNSFDSPEVGLKELVQETVKSEKLKISNKPEKADAFIICVETPLNEKATVCDLSYVKSAAVSIIPFLEKGNTVILESTVPPGTTKNVLLPALENSGLKAGKDFYLAHCPERLLPGSLLNEIINNDRVIGGIDEKSSAIAKELYSSFVKGKIFITDATTAELSKLMENTYRDINIALANEFALVCDKLGINVWEAIELANKHPRVNIHSPGPGVGGHCIPKDPWLIFESHPDGVKIIKTAREINDFMPKYVVEMIKKSTKDIKNPKISLLGVSYKANVDDIRESPSTKIIKLLIESGYTFNAHDPHVKDYKFELHNLEDTVKDADCIVVCVDHEEYKNINPKNIANLVRNKIIIDTKNCMNRNLWESYGFNFVLLGDNKSGK